MFPQLARPICRAVITNSAKTNCVRRAHGSVVPKDKPLMDLLPIPEGPWEEAYKANNAKYNVHLIAGFAFFAISFGVMYKGGFLFMNAVPPPLPKK